jgi:hypothetical protein
MSLKKILLQFCFLFIFSALIISCETSEKGKWTSKDKETARNDMEKEFLKFSAEGDEFFSIKENRDHILDCCLGKLEQNYSSYLDADKDEKGCEKIGEECALAVIEATAPLKEENSDSIDEEKKPKD